MSSTPLSRLPFSFGQLAIIIVFGWIVWFLGALVCRLAGEMGWFDGTNRILLYAAVVPGTLSLVPTLKRIARLPDAHVALGMSIATAAAIMLDGIALAWFPALYGDGVDQIAASGAVILWGGFVAIALGCLFNRVPQQ